MVSLLLVLVFVFFSDGEDDDSFDDAAAEVNNLLVLVVVVGVRRAPFPPFPPPRKGLFSFLVFSPPPRQEGRDKSTLLGEEEEEEEEENIIISLCVMLFFPVRKNFCWCFPTVFSNEKFLGDCLQIFSLFFLIKRKLKNTSSRGTHHLITRAQKKKNDDDENDDDFEENDFDSSLPLRRELFVWDFNCFCRAGIPNANERCCVLFFFSIIFLKIIIVVAFWRLCLFFLSHRRGLQNSAPLPARRRRLRRVLSVCRGRSRFEEGCFSRKFFFCFFFSTKTEDWRKKWVLLDDVGKNTNHFIETLFSRGAKNTNHQNVFFSTLMT